MLEAVLWDKDGVLVDTGRLYFHATREINEEAGVRLSYRGLMSAHRAGLRCIVVPNDLTRGGDFRDA